MKAKKSRIIGIVSISLTALVLCLTALGLHMIKQNDRLSEAQIEALRAEYPICGNAGRAHASIGSFTMDEVLDVANTFIYGTVEGEMTTYSKYISTGNSALDEKRESVGLGNTYGFYKYTISVIEDTEGKLQKGEKIELSDNIALIDYNPHLSDGMKIIVPVDVVDEANHEYTSFVCGTYYVTDDGYAVSAFDENKAQMKKSMSGVRVEKLLEELKK